MEAAPIPDHLTQIISLVRLVLTYVLPGGFIYFIVKITGKSPLEIGETMFEHFAHLVEKIDTLKSLNALWEILAFVLAVVFFVSPLRDIFAPAINQLAQSSSQGSSLAAQAMLVFTFVSFLLASFTCMWFCSYERP